jgi:hypothetical protein
MNGTTCSSTAFKTISDTLAEDESFTVMRGTDPVEICAVKYDVYN